MTKPRYDTDFYQWTQAQAAHLRAKDFAALDLETWPKRSRAWATNSVMPSAVTCALSFGTS